MRDLDERWYRSLPFAEGEWERGNWRKSPISVRVREWDRHLGGLGLSLTSFVGKDVLEVGCGPTGLVYFIDASRRVGVDPAAQSFESANGHWGAPIELINAPAESLPFEDAIFDAVICVNVLDHTRDPEAIINEIGRVSRTGATLVFHVDVDSPLRKLHKMVRTECRRLHPQALSYAWVLSRLGRWFEVEQTERDREVFRATPSQLRYEAYWDGLMYRLTKSDRWQNHVWIRGRRR